MEFRANQNSQPVVAVPLGTFSILETIGEDVWKYTSDGISDYHLYLNDVEQTVPSALTGSIYMSDVSQISGIAITTRTRFEVYNTIVV